MINDITLPEVQSLTQRAEFFKQGERHMVKISYVGSKDNVIKKVGPEHMAMFKADWDAYCDGQPLTRRPGTQLTDCEGIDKSRADNYIARNIHNLEELAALSDGQCQALGHGTLTDRKAAQHVLAMRKMQEDTSRRDAVGKAASLLTAPPAVPNAEVAELGKKIDALTDGVTALVRLMSEQNAPKKKSGPKVT